MLTLTATATVTSNRLALIELARSIVRGVLEESGLDAEGIWIGVVPVRHGTLRATFQYEIVEGPFGLALVLLAGFPTDEAPEGAPYAIFIELGTSRMPAQMPLRRTADHLAPIILQRLRLALGTGV